MTKKKKAKKLSPSEVEKRDLEIYEACESGMPYAYLADKYGLTRERVRQIHQEVKDKKNAQE